MYNRLKKLKESIDEMLKSLEEAKGETGDYTGEDRLKFAAERILEKLHHY